MDKRRCYDAYQACDFAGKYSIVKKVCTIYDLHNFNQPYHKKDDGRRDKAQDEPFVFNIGFARQGVKGIGTMVEGRKGSKTGNKMQTIQTLMHVQYTLVPGPLPLFNQKLPGLGTQIPDLLSSLPHLRLAQFLKFFFKVFAVI